MTGDNVRAGLQAADLAATDFHQLAADRMKLGMPPAEIGQELVARGLDPEDAQSVVQRVGEARRQRRRSVGRASMIVGALACLAGVAATVATYLTAAEHHGGYLIFYGAAIYGACQFLWGLIRYRSA